MVQIQNVIQRKSSYCSDVVEGFHMQLWFGSDGLTCTITHTAMTDAVQSVGVVDIISEVVGFGLYWN